MLGTLHLRKRLHLFLCSLALGVSLAPQPGHAQAPLPIYTDNLVNGFEDWSWVPSGRRNFANVTTGYSGTKSISATAYFFEAIAFRHVDFNTRPYASLVFWANGGAGGQSLQVGATTGTTQQPYFNLPGVLPTNTWQQYVIPLGALNAADVSNLNRLAIKLNSGGTSNTFYLDDVQLTAKPAPALVNLSVNTTQAVRAVESRWFGANTAVWDGNFNTPQTRALLAEIGTRVLRFPGGSESDNFRWASNKRVTTGVTWVTSFAHFMSVATNLGAQAFITVNYGTGTAEEAAAWVRHANVTNQCAFKYWEIGNENYGPWEMDSNSFPHDPYTYAVRATNYIALMKAADPSIEIGIPVAPGENSYSNAYSLSHPAVNPRTGQTNYGWTPIVLATLRSFGVTPDFLIHHHYPQYNTSSGGQESDPLVLQSAINWQTDAADLRQQLTDYLGAAGTNVELVVTENNAKSGIQGKQSTSLVNGLYYADSLGQFMKTEFNAFVWWDFRNGTDTTGGFDPTLYGWRTYGDQGLVNGLTNRHPTFYAAKLMSAFAQPGDTVLNPVSDYLLLSMYAVRRASGAVSLLVINKDTQTNFNARIALAGFTPGPTATLRTYGIPQDEAARTNAPYAFRDVATNSFSGAAASFDYNFPPLSLTQFSLVPAAPQLAVLSAPAGQFVFQLQGQLGVRYMLQTSTDLQTWSFVATNTLAAGTLNVTNDLLPGPSVRFWRAVWLP